jgi:hypothetical protein
MLRKSFAIFFLCAYSLVVLKPLFPLVDYALNKEYIAKNLCENRNKPKMHCNGKCHLMKQLKKANADVPSDGNTTKGNSNQEENVVHVNSLFSFNAEVSTSQTATNFYLNTFSHKLPSSYLKDIFHPPRA